MVCREQVGSGWGNVLRTAETQKAKPSGVREVPRILRSVVHFGNLAGNQRSRRDGMSRASGVGAASAGPNRRSRRDGVSRASGVGARSASAGPLRSSRRGGVSRARGVSQGGFRGPEPIASRWRVSRAGGRLQGGFRGPEPIASRWRVASERGRQAASAGRTEDRVAIMCRERRGGGFRPGVLARWVRWMVPDTWSGPQA